MERVVVENLSFSYRHGFELKGISLKVWGGSVVTLLGPNGSGKTTLLKCINALLKPRTNCVYVDGKDVLKMREDERAKLMGYVPQSHSPTFPYTVLDVVLMGRTPYLGVFQRPSKADVAKAEEALKLVGLNHLKDRPYTEISGGERQLVLIARALAQDPRVILLDEPTAHLDFRNQFRVLRVVREVAKRKDVAVVMSLHDPNLAYLFSDAIALMSGGRIVAFGDPNNVITKENIKAVYGMDVEIVDNERGRLVLPLEVMP
ncbi:MAG: ABC transporter ATP-binding protein [Thaumarchaeota archaeon]|nr:ABC transporter ATP-binding protein [Nitrososphaerota archaeon]